MSEVDISIIIPIYNVAKWLPRCLSSVINQSYKNYEVILVNDGSTDKSEDICKRYLEKDNRFRYFKKKNGGLSDARNYGLKFVNGKYVVFIDSDDFVEKDYLKKLYQRIKIDKSELAICEYNIVENKKNNSVQKFNFPSNLKNIDGRKLLTYIYQPDSVTEIVAWNRMYKRELFDKLSFQKGKYFEDEFLLVPLMWNIKKISLIREPLYDYVQRKGSITNTSYSDKKIKNIDEFKNQRIAFFKNNDLDLYKLAVQDYKNWITTIWYQRKNVKDQVLWDYLYSQFKKYHSIVKPVRIKDKIRENLSLISISGVSFLINIKHKFSF